MPSCMSPYILRGRVVAASQCKRDVANSCWAGPRIAAPASYKQAKLRQVQHKALTAAAPLQSGPPPWCTFAQNSHKQKARRDSGACAFCRLESLSLSANDSRCFAKRRLRHLCLLVASKCTVEILAFNQGASSFSFSFLLLELSPIKGEDRTRFAPLHLLKGI